MRHRNFLTLPSILALPLALLLSLPLLAAAQPKTIASYPDLAAAVRQRMEGKSVPTPALGALALQLTAGRTDPRARALALADWVRTHLRHSDARLRLDAPAPRTAAQMLAQRDASCEEMVVLLQALLTTSGIDSTAALVGRGDDYTLPDAPLEAGLDHVIVYLPALALYLDPATDNIAAGYLAPALLGKPALLVAGGGFAMTPMMQAQGVRSTATIDIGRDGSGTFRLDRTYAGALAEPARKAAGQAAGPSGAGGDPFRITLSGVRRRFASVAGKQDLPTTYPNLGSVPEVMAGMPWESAARRDVACPAVDAEDETRYQLPKKMRVLALPAPVSVIQGGVFYRADYERQGNAVLVKRRLTFRNGRPTCTPAQVRALQPTLDRIARDLRSRITIAGR
jgi:hypothetical protein